jgi:hypothetical protein
MLFTIPILASAATSRQPLQDDPFFVASMTVLGLAALVVMVMWAIFPVVTYYQLKRTNKLLAELCDHLRGSTIEKD